MREIKFRGKRIDNDEWVYGWFSEDYGFAEILTEYNDCEVILETVGQYTGLKDRDGVEIYEGDVIQEFAGEHAQGVWEHSNVSVVEDLRWIPESLGFADCTYIIGNIHDNPELIKEKKNETDVMTDHAAKARRMIYQFEHDPIEHCWNFRDDTECPMFQFANNGGYCNLSEKMIYNEWDEILEGMPDWCEIVRID